MADMAAGDSYVRFQFFGYQINNWNKVGKLYMTVTDRVLFILTKYYGGGVYFKSKTKEGKSVERQGHKATEPEAQQSMAASYIEVRNI